MDAITDTLLKSVDGGVNGIFLGLFLLMFYQLKVELKEHKEEYNQLVSKMFEVVNRNTEINSKLAASIEDIKDRLDK